MSNTQVGNVYSQIITDVIDSSRVDFEEGGVDETVLEELRLGWQSKLSQLQVAAFPWDPKPEPMANMSIPPTVPSNAGNYANTPPQMQGGLTMPQNNNGGPRIKTEPGLEPMQQPYQQPNNPLTLPASTNIAAQRAQQHILQSYGPQAAASINAIQGGGNRMNQQQAQQRQQQQNGQPMNLQPTQQMHMMQARAQGQNPNQSPNMMQAPQGMQQGQRPPMSQEQYKHIMAQQMADQARRNQNGVGGAQTDGAGEEEVESYNVIKQFNSAGEEISMGRIDIDGLIRSKIEAMGTSMEGGGLMLPLASASSSRSRKAKASLARSKGKGKGKASEQTDGPDDEDDKNGVKDEVVDEDAINSELDDPDDGLNEEDEEDEGMGHIMLCMYDKVQRVKNKWKCVMKDGVLTVNGKEYVFHKASGEYEW